MWRVFFGVYYSWCNDSVFNLKCNHIYGLLNFTALPHNNVSLSHQACPACQHYVDTFRLGVLTYYFAKCGLSSVRPCSIIGAGCKKCVPSRVIMRVFCGRVVKVSSNDQLVLSDSTSGFHECNKSSILSISKCASKVSARRLSCCSRCWLRSKDSASTRPVQLSRACRASGWSNRPWQ